MSNPPNQALDREIAKLIGRDPAIPDWSPSSNLTTAWEVVEEVCKRLKCDFKLVRSPTLGVLARFEVGKGPSVTLSRFSSPTLAIAEAAVTAFREAPKT